MKKRHTYVRPIREELECESCYWGTMVSTGEVLASNPPRYQHKCSNPRCEVTTIAREKYPRIIYEDVPEGD